MMNRAISVITGLRFIVLFRGQADPATAPEIKVWTARAIATGLAEFGPQFERTTGYKLAISSDLPTAFARRANAGEPFDILISGSAPVDEWIKDGKIIADTRADIARSGVGVEVSAGARVEVVFAMSISKQAIIAQVSSSMT